MKKRKVIWIGVGFLLGLLMLVFLVSHYFSGKIEEQIRKAVTAQEEIDVDLFQRQISVSGIKVQQGSSTLTASEISLKGLDYWEYLINDRLVIDVLEVKAPKAVIVRKEPKQQDHKKNFQKKILIRNIQISDGLLRLKKNDSAENNLFLRIPKVSFSEVKIDSATLKTTIPFKYNSYLLEADSLSVKMNPEHYVAAGELSIENGKASIKDFQIIPYFEKAEFDQKIPYEKDRISLKVNKIELDSLSFSFQNDTLFLNNPLMTLAGGNLEVYRNKLLPDDSRIKSLFSKKMRHSPIKFNFEQVKVTGSTIKYEEKVKQTGPLAKIMFTDIEGTIENLGNINMNRKDFPRTKVNARAHFMGGTTINMDWSFNATNLNDKFLISGDFGALQANHLNPLLKPSLGLEAEGDLESISFTFTGNDDAGSGDVRVIYDSFKINVMRKKGEKKNKLLSALANLFVDNDGLSERRTHNVQFTRDKTKSFWNYIWIGLKKGVFDALSQL